MVENKMCYIDKISYNLICDFLNNIADHVGDKITEYHWREACAILLAIDNPEQKERRAKLLELEYANIQNDVTIDIKEYRDFTDTDSW